MENISEAKRLREEMRLLERKLGVLEENQVSCCEITLTQCHAMVEVGRAEKISLNELADILNLENSTMSRTVNNLVKSGVVKRVIDENDRRYVKISLDEKGEELFNSVETKMDLYYQKVYDSIPEDKRSQVLESIQLLVEALGKNGTGKTACD